MRILEINLDDDGYIQIDVKISHDEFRIITIHLFSDEFSMHVHSRDEYINLIRDTPMPIID